MKRFAEMISAHAPDIDPQRLREISAMASSAEPDNVYKAGTTLSNLYGPSEAHLRIAQRLADQGALEKSRSITALIIDAVPAHTPLHTAAYDQLAKLPSLYLAKADYETAFELAQHCLKHSLKQEQMERAGYLLMDIAYAMNLSYATGMEPSSAALRKLAGRIVPGNEEDEARLQAARAKLDVRRVNMLRDITLLVQADSVLEATPLCALARDYHTHADNMDARVFADDIYPTMRADSAERLKLPLLSRPVLET